MASFSLQESTGAMMRNAEAQCSHMFEVSGTLVTHSWRHQRLIASYFKEIKDDLKASTHQRCKLPSNSIKDFILKNAGTEIVNKVRWVCCADVTNLSSWKSRSKILGARRSFFGWFQYAKSVWDKIMIVGNMAPFVVAPPAFCLKIADTVKISYSWAID